VQKLKILSVISAILIFTLSFVTTSEAKDKKLVANWSANETNILVLGKADLIEKTGVKKVLVDAITQKLHSLQAVGKLPFELNETNDFDINSLTNSREDYSDEELHIGIVPIVALDNAYDSSYSIFGSEGVTYHKSIVTSSIYFVVMSTSQDGLPSRILASVPMSGCIVLGSRTPTTVPFAEETKITAYKNLTIGMINQELNFDAVKKSLKDWEKKQYTGEVYQVTEVEITSDKANNEIFKTAADKAEIQSFIANFFTAEYQKKTKKILLPPILDEQDRVAVKEVEQGLSSMGSFKVRGSSGVLELQYEQPPKSRQIKLNLSGLNYGEMQRSEKNASDVRTDWAYKVWLKEVMNGKEIELNDSQSVAMPKKNAYFKIDEKEIFTDLLIGLARKLGAAKG